MNDIQESFEKLRLELRRGVLVLTILSHLEKASYAYSLIQQLAEQGISVEEGMLYPLLRRLEQQGLLESDWDVSEARARKYYRINPAGREVLRLLQAEWHEIVSVIHKIQEGNKHE